MAHEVFLSYAGKDQADAEAVCQALEQQGIACWMAPRDIQPGTGWPEAIVAAVQSSALMVLLFSENANASAHVARELSLAADAWLPILPFRIEPAHPQKGLRFLLAGQQWLDGYRPPPEVRRQELVDAVERLLAQKGKGPQDSAAEVSPPQAEDRILALETPSFEVGWQGRAPQRDRADGRPAMAVGDYLEVTQVREDRVAIAIGDSSSHGLKAAETTRLVATALRAFSNLDASPAQILTHVNAFLADGQERSFFACTYGVADGARRSLRYAMAGYSAPILLRHGDVVRGLHQPAMPIGILPETTFTDPGPEALHPGDWVLLFTDSLIDKPGADHEAYGLRRVEASLARHAHAGASVPSVLAGVLSDYRDHLQQAPGDLTSIAALHVR